MSKIIRICQGQPELAVRIVQPGCGGQLINFEDIRLVIQAPHCDCMPCSPFIVNGCWPGYPGPFGEPACPASELPALVYPAFDTNDKGETVFKFDNRLWSLPPGRYFGNIEFNNGMAIDRLDIDLCTIPFLVDRVSVTHEPCSESGDC